MIIRLYKEKNVEVDLENLLKQIKVLIYINITVDKDN